MYVTATVGKPKPNRGPTLAGLGDDVLADVEYDGVHIGQRFGHAGAVYELSDEGRVTRTGDAPEQYTVLEVLGPLTYNFEA